MTRNAGMLAAAAVWLLVGCGPRNFKNENDRLRARVLELEQQLESLTARTSELESALAASSTLPQEFPESVRANLPYVADITLGRLGFARDDNDDGRPDTVVLYVKPTDGLGRFTQMIGRLSAHVALLPPDHDAITLGRVDLDPATLRGAYRSSITGTHYTIEIPIDIDQAPGPAAEAIARVEFTDGLSGRMFSAEQAIRLDAAGTQGSDTVSSASRDP